MRKRYDNHNIRKFVIGSGGSAFSDGGFGAVQALQVFDFFDENGQRVDGFVPFGEARRVREAQVIDPDFLNNVSVLMPCDVTSPLLGFIIDKVGKRALFSKYHFYYKRQLAN